MKPRVLVVDDSKVICNTLQKLIVEELDYEPIIAHSKAQCEELLLKYKDSIDVALLDLELPDAKIGQVVDYVTNFNIPSIVLTSSIDKEELFRSKNLVDYVIKENSFSFSYAISLVKRVINNKGKEVVVFGEDAGYLKKIATLIKRYQLKPIILNDSQDLMNELSNSNNIEVIFIHLEHSNQNGYEILKQVRKKYSRNNLIITIITEKVDNSKMLAKFLKMGANDFLYEDFEEEEFYARLTLHLDNLDIFKDIQTKANQDYLTGAYNRRYFFQEGFRRFQKTQNVKLFIIDIDKFKIINDTYGHAIGDIVLKDLVKTLQEKLLSFDSIISRFGGEEFCVVMFDIENNIFLETLEMLRQTFEKSTLKIDDNIVQYTISIGYTYEKLESLDEMINNADKGLYQAKTSGRNQSRSLYEN